MPAALLRQDLADVLLGGLFLALGSSAFGLAASRRQSGNRSLLGFGIFTALYGLRLLTDTAVLLELAGASPLVLDTLTACITYGLPLGGTLAAESAFGPGLGSSLVWLRRLQTLYAAVAVPLDLAFGPETAMGPNNFLVLLAMGVFAVNGGVALAQRLRAGHGLGRDVRALLAGAAVLMLLGINENLVNAGLVPWTWSQEALGMLALVAGLGYAISHRFFVNERQLDALNQEMETARRIQSAILPRAMPEVRGLALAARYQPMASVGGDFYDFLAAGPGQVGALVADVSGHGVPAALIASMVKIALASQAEHAADPAGVLREMNRILTGKLERSFVTAAYLFVDAGAGRVVYASAGHPPLLWWRRAEGEVREIVREGLPLGRFRQARYESQEWTVAPGDRLLLYTDGIPEALNSAGESFGEDGLREFLGSGTGAEELVDGLLARLAAWSGRRPGEPLDDDVTVVAIDVL